MSMTDPIADMLTRIRNAGRVGLPTTAMPGSKLKVAIAEALKENGYLTDYTVASLANGGTELQIELKYTGKKNVHVIEGIERVSKPSRRVYAGSGEIPRVLGGLGVAILSTSQGVMSGRAARKLNIGGEVLCYVW